MIRLTFSPLRDDRPLRLELRGGLLVIDGATLDLSGLPEGAELPAGAIDHPRIAGPARRTGGVLHLCLHLPHGLVPAGATPAAVMAPAPMMVTTDGPVAIPRWPDVEPEAAAPAAPVTVDWSQMITAAEAAEAALVTARTAARARLTAHITTARAALITVLPGQDMIYQAKEAEARAWIADPSPDPANYPLLAAEIGLTAPDAHSLAQLWLNMAQLWRQAAAELEALRLGVGAAIDAAETVEEVEAALQTLDELTV